MLRVVKYLISEKFETFDSVSVKKIQKTRCFLYINRFLPLPRHVLSDRLQHASGFSVMPSIAMVTHAMANLALEVNYC